MRLLFVLDNQDYLKNGSQIIRPSVRGIIIRDGKLALVYSQKLGYYKFPGGGIDHLENHFDTLIREVKEEVGLVVDVSSIKPYGLVKRIQKGLVEDIFIQDNYYYFCKVDDEILAQNLDCYESDEGFTLEWIKPNDAINNNHQFLSQKNPEIKQVMVKRDTNVLEMLINEGFFNYL